MEEILLSLATHCLRSIEDSDEKISICADCSIYRLGDWYSPQTYQVKACQILDTIGRAESSDSRTDLKISVLVASHAGASPCTAHNSGDHTSSRTP